ncbi:MAG TPA: hypothetical protein VFI39_05800 [Gemmatimonadales bacterium]|nr:hypothetical protein [Gemmatimonadales bacterium]
MNYAHDDYVMGHLLRFARSTKHDTLLIDLMTGTARPQALLQSPIEDVPRRYASWLRDLVKNHRSDMRFVHTAALTLHFNLAVARPLRGDAKLSENPYRCDVVITDDRGKEYAAHFEGWWYPERTNESADDHKPWWKFW